MPEQLIEQAVKKGRATHIGRRVKKVEVVFWGRIIINAIHDDGKVIGFTKLTIEVME